MRAGLLHTSRAGLLVLAGVAGCSNPAPPKDPAAAASADGSVSAESEGLPALTPAPPPDNLVGVATLRTPARTLDTAMGWTGLGLDFRTMVQAGPGAVLLPILDLEAPLDVVVTIDPKVKNRPRALFAASVGLTSSQAALDVFKSLDFPVELVEPGVHSVIPNPKTFCFVSPALGKAKYRLVCGEDRESVELLSPYLTRGTPSEGTGDADLHVELRAEAPWRLFGEKTQFLELGIPMLLGEVSIGNAEFDAALRDGATAMVDELILGLGDLKDLRLDAWLRTDAAAVEKNELEIEIGVAFNAARSWIARSLADGEARADVAPPVFWTLPNDATQAAYYSVSNPAVTESAIAVLGRLFQSGLNHLGASPALQRAWPSAFEQAMAVKGPLVSARGGVPKALLPAAPDARDELRADLGYTLVGIEDPLNRYGAWFEQTLKLYEDPTLRKNLALKYGLDVAALPKAQSKKGPAKLDSSRTVEVSLPAALIAEAMDQKGEDARKLAPVPVVIVTCRKGDYTWFGVSSFGALAEQKLTALVTQSAADATLATRSGLDRLRQDRGNVAGFWTLAGLASGPSFGGGQLSRALAPLGDSEVPMVGRAYGRSAGPAGEIELHVPAQVFRDAAGSLARRQ